MVRTVSHLEDEETHDSSSPTADSKRVDQKVNSSRSKHSETEQRRRSKINERFQILRDLIPENDQKRDKASFLLEVIQYIQFLQEKLQIYEGSCQGWSPEPGKSLPLRINCGQLESFVDQSQLDRNFTGHEDNVLHQALLSNAQNSVEPDFSGAVLYKSTDSLPMAAKTLPLNMPLQEPLFEDVPGQSHQGSFPDAEQLIQQSQSHFWPGRSCGDNCSVPIYAGNEEELKSENGEATISDICSQELFNSLTTALQSSGVDLSKAKISVQLDVGKRTNGENTNTMFYVKDHEHNSGLNYGALMNTCENYEQLQKRFRADHT